MSDDVEEIEVIADRTADVWRLRACDDEDGCVVVERYLTRHIPEDQLTRAINAAFPISQRDLDEPHEEIHIPRDVWREFVRGVLRDEIKRASVRERIDLLDALCDRGSNVDGVCRKCGCVLSSCWCD